MNSLTKVWSDIWCDSVILISPLVGEIGRGVWSRLSWTVLASLSLLSLPLISFSLGLRSSWQHSHLTLLLILCGWYNLSLIEFPKWGMPLWHLTVLPLRDNRSYRAEWVHSWLVLTGVSDLLLAPLFWHLQSTFMLQKNYKLLPSRITSGDSGHSRWANVKTENKSSAWVLEGSGHEESKV